MKNRIILILSIFLTLNVYGQTDQPKSILASKSYSYETLALVVRFDKGIDSINFPIDTNLIKIQNKKLDFNGKNLSPKKVYYEYRFTAKIDTTYKLPSAQLWSNNTSYEIPLNEYVILKKPQKPVKLSKADSLKLVDKEDAERLERQNSAEKVKLESEIDSRISKKIKKQVILLWTDKDVLKIDDNFRIVIESNMEFDMVGISTEYVENLSNKYKVLKNSTNISYKNGYGNYYRTFICKALSEGEIIIEPFEIKTVNKAIHTNQWSFNIIE